MISIKEYLLDLDINSSSVFRRSKATKVIAETQEEFATGDRL